LPGLPTRQWGAAMAGQRSRSRIRSWIGVTVLVLITLAVAATVLLVYGRHNVGAAGLSVSPDQVNLESSIVNDRKHLFKGVLRYRPLSPVAVGDTTELDVTLIAVGKNPGQVFILPGKVIGSRSLQVGGVEGATLAARGGGMKISQVGPARGLIGQPGDSVSWIWNITPDEPGDYILELVVVTYQGSSDNPLSVVNPPVQIALDVTDTWSHRISSLKGWIIGLGAFFAALAIIFTFFREQVFGLLPKRAKKKEETAGSDSETKRASDTPST
jgi:hypothetical protein